MEALKRLEVLDFHPKLVKDFAVRTKTGAIVSVLAVVIASILLWSETSAYLTTEKVEHMEVDPVRDSKLRINFDVTFPDMPCAVVSLDAMDASGSHQLEVMHDVVKKRLGSNGQPFQVERAERGTLKDTAGLLKERRRAEAEGRKSGPNSTDPTGSPETAADGAASSGDDAAATATAVAAPLCETCYGAEAQPGDCCNTCESVRDAYRKKGWGFNMKGITQCQREGFVGDVKAQLDAQEGCNIVGHIFAPKVAGNLHFAPGHGVQHAYAHIHDLVAFTVSAFNISHVINSVSFGEEIPNRHYPLDGLSRMLDTGSGMHQYFIKLVPTVYKPLGRPEVHSYQFSVTEHLKRIDARLINTESANGMLPGVFFNYELSPMRVRIVERRNSLGHFLTRLCAIIGGVFTIMSMVDRLLESGLDGLAKARRRKGGAHGGALMKD